VRKGRNIRLNWEHLHARIDDRDYHPPKKDSPVKITLDDRGLRVQLPSQAD
jgi:hypothetical protein